ncbi:hypothetical protein Micbo1qcDRAFT_156884 [Microdochium bolleyi]|uniref:Uncharacterized protein n=1 Tax=Microdochium bolleyi TaxID=196109 RepID=A0A136JD94_9PEZI|nr:hypothetical protein Micbo1qcDRAFT_156884 [Microdochium bolleyi]
MGSPHRWVSEMAAHDGMQADLRRTVESHTWPGDGQQPNGPSHCVKHDIRSSLARALKAFAK